MVPSQRKSGKATRALIAILVVADPAQELAVGCGPIPALAIVPRSQPAAYVATIVPVMSWWTSQRKK